MAVVQVEAGICGFKTRIVAQADEALNVTLTIESDCAQIRHIAEELIQVSALDEMRRPINETTPYRLAAAYKAHVACVVPSAILKAIEIAAGLALPADVHITVVNE